MERMVANRMSFMAENLGWWSDAQAGFRRARSCEDQLLRLTQSISDGFQEKKPLRSVLALLDFSNAYDKVWKSLLLKRLLDKNVPTRMIVWLRGFLRNRRAKVKWNGECGDFRQLKQGLPQGSVLAPLLFLFFIDPVTTALPQNVHVSLYADDVAIWARHREKEVAASRIETAVQAVAEWSRSVKLQLNQGKCEVAFFSKDSHEARYQPVVSMDGRQLTVTAEPVFLGITLDRTLSFRRQVAKVCGKVSARCRLLGAVASKDWGCERRTMKMLFHALVRGAMDYSGAAWQPWLSKTGMDELERAHNKALRAVTGQLRTTPVEALHMEVATPKYSRVVDYLAASAWEKARRLPEGHPRKAATDHEVPQRTKGGSWRTLAKQVCSESGLDNEDTDGLIWRGPPPWERRAQQRWSVKASLAGGSTRNESTETLKADALNTLRMIVADATIYTDGSAAEGVREGGSAAVVSKGSPKDPVMERVYRRKGVARTSSFETEAGALHLALDWAVDDSDA
jgi:hypothetical protein